MVVGINQAYLQGALHDGTRNNLHNTYRISQKEIEWLKLLKSILAELGHKSWIYKEGKSRNVYVLETTAPFLSLDFDPCVLSSSLLAFLCFKLLASGFRKGDWFLPSSKSFDI